MPKYKLDRGPAFAFTFVGGTLRTPATRQLCQWSGASQIWTATSSLDRATSNNRYDSANAGPSQRALSISAQ